MTSKLLHIPADEYHADPCPAPSLSNSILQTLLRDSPFHAWFCHPKLNPNRPDSGGSRLMARGTVVHKLALDAGSEVVVLEYADYRKKDAQAARDEALAQGRTPILRDDYDRATALAKPLRERLEAYLGAPINDCLREQVLIWEEDGCWRRIMIDAMSPDLLHMADLKSTEGSVSPHALSRKVYTDDYHIQAAFYLRGMDAHDPANAGRRHFTFLFGQQSAPFVCGPPIELSEGGLELGRQQVETGVRLWDSCMRANRWPAYGTDTYIAEPPPWLMQQWQMRYETDESMNPIEWSAEQLYGVKK